MPNVKPGDLARIIRDPNSHDGHSNVGRQVHVVDFPADLSRRERFMLQAMTRKHGPTQLVAALEPIWGAALGLERSLCTPGELLLMADAYLQRIDPPADTQDVFTASPTSADRRPMEELADHRLYTKERTNGTPNKS